MSMRPRTRIARRLRRDATDVEKQLWRALRELPAGHRFRRQHPIGPFIVDFACPGRKLAIELDGGQHATGQAADTARTTEIARHGYRVVRFWNNDVTDNLSGVLEMIRREVEDAPLRPSGRRGRGPSRSDGRVRWVSASALQSPTSPRPSPPPGAERE